MSGSRRVDGRLGAYVDGYRSRLLELGYSPLSVLNSLAALGHLGRSGRVGESGGGGSQLVAAVLGVRDGQRDAGLEHRAPAPGVEVVADVAGVDLEGAVREADHERGVAAGLAGQAVGRCVAGAGELDEDERQVGRVGGDRGEQRERAVQPLFLRGLSGERAAGAYGGSDSSRAFGNA